MIFIKVIPRLPFKSLSGSLLCEGVAAATTAQNSWVTVSLVAAKTGPKDD